MRGVSSSKTGRPVRVVVMGVAGCGKTTVGRELATALGAIFIEADEFHHPASIAKMSNGIPLDDADRWPWLASLVHAMHAETSVVVACSALKRNYRDLLRRAGDVRFVFLDVDRPEIERRMSARVGHYMGPNMIESQFRALERPGPDETDIATVPPDATVQDIVGLLTSLQPGTAAVALLADGDRERVISAYELGAHLETVISQHVLPNLSAAKRVLLVPPDHTRLYSGAGEITAQLFQGLTTAGCEVAVLPAVGTHVAMTRADSLLLFGEAVPYSAILHHRWRDGVVRVGEIAASEVQVLSDGRFSEAIPIEVDEVLFDSWDLVISIGQVVPHEVIGMANYTKNVVIGLGGAPTIHRSHFVGSVCDMETIMGRADSPVRRVVDAAFDRFLSQRLNMLWVLTVMEDTLEGVVQRGLFVGRGGSGDTGAAAYRDAAALAAECNIDAVETPFTRVACWLDPNEFRTTWLGNKAIYRTRMAIGDGGELIILAPGVARFGEDPAIDVLIRRHGYRGTTATLAALTSDEELAGNLAAAAHLIHGSSEGRFTITYCTDPDDGGLTQAEVEGVGFAWRHLRDELRVLAVGPSSSAGRRDDAAGVAFDFISNPALGLWACSQ